MKVGFFHDHRFICRGNTTYTTGTLNYKVWDRYLEHDIDELIVCARNDEGAGIDVSKLAISSKDKVTFVFSPNLSNLSALLLNAKKDVVEDVVRKVDVVVCRLPSEIGFAAIELAKKHNKKTICEVVACPYDALSYHGSLTAKFYASLIRYRMKKWVSECDGAIYVTEKELQRRYPNSGIKQNASNVELDEIKTDCINERSDRFRLRKNAGKLKIGIIGTLKNDTKGIDVAIKALSNKDCSLHVIGSGEPARFITMAKNHNTNFIYDGFFSDKKDVYQWLDDIDVYLQPSYQEGLPRATIEAMSRGCIVLSSNAGGLPELVLEEYIHKSGDFNKLASDIETIFATEDPGKDIQHSLCTSSHYLSSVLKRKRTEFYANFLQR